MLRSGEDTAKAWASIKSAAINNETVVNVFLLLPDEPKTQPFDAVYGKRVQTPDQEARSYAEILVAIDLILPMLNNQNYTKLMQDLPHGEGADPGVWETLKTFNERATKDSLKQLRTIIDGARPHHKRLSKDKNDGQAARATYTILVADLNRYLKLPKHSALAALARANHPNINLTDDAIKKAWKNSCPVN